MSNQAMTWAFAYEAPSSTCKLVLLPLANYADENGECFPSVQRIVQQTGLSERAVRNAIAKLIDVGAISKTERRRKDGTQTASRYTLNMQGAPDAVCTVNRVHDVPVQGAPRAPLTSFEPSLEPSLEASLRRSPPIRCRRRRRTGPPPVQGPKTTGPAPAG